MIGQPVTVFYDADGHVASTWEGQLSQSALDQGIHAAIRSAYADPLDDRTSVTLVHLWLRYARSAGRSRSSARR